MKRSQIKLILYLIIKISNFVIKSSFIMIYVLLANVPVVPEFGILNAEMGS